MEDDQIPPERASTSGVPIYLSVTADMLNDFNFNQALAGTCSADCVEFLDFFNLAADKAREVGDTNAEAIYGALSALCGFHFRPDDVNDPFGPMMQMENRRSAMPEDFRASASAVAKMAEHATDVCLRARLSDVAWLLNRRRVDLGLAAIRAYCQTVREVAEGSRKFRFQGGNSPASAQSRDLLKRALSLATMRSVGLGKVEENNARQLAADLLETVLLESNVRDANRIASLALQYGVIPATDLGRKLEDWLGQAIDVDDHSALELWRLCAAAYHQSGASDDHFRCRLEVVNILSAMASDTSAIIATGHLSQAISELHGVPNSRERRLELRHRLIDVQANIADEMSTFSHEVDLSEIVAQREASFNGLSLRDALFLFADMSHSPSPEELRSNAIKTVDEHPLSALFSGSFHDRAGKVAFRSAGMSLSSSPTDEELRPTVAQSERIRRQIFATGDIQTARRMINEHFYLTDETFLPLLRHSPFVPNELLRTYVRGFRRFFQGDPISGVYILTPLLEASVRRLLKERGHDVSTFDNATKTQQDLTISAMFDQMKTELVGIFGTAIVADIENVFLSQPGPTIRHEIAHGLMSDGGPYGPDAAYACWLIFRLCMIPLFAFRERFDSGLWQQ